MKTTEPPIVVTELYNTSVEKVWSAITTLGEMQQWFFPNIPAYKAEVGFSTEFIIEHEGRVFPHLWKVLEIIPLQKMVQEWKFGGYPGCSKVFYELKAIGKKTQLTLTDIIIESFPNDIPEFKRESGVEGWNYFIKDSLKKYLEK
jgi:uncharacterized protein YndB with AHSA1/START domain